RLVPLRAPLPRPHARRSCPLHSPPTPHFRTLSLHDALPISVEVRIYEKRLLTDEPPSAAAQQQAHGGGEVVQRLRGVLEHGKMGDRKSTRLNSSHVQTSYAVFCLKKKKLPTRRDDRPYAWRG